eukprot:2459668-Rhodomonas_salina.1
MKEAKEKKRVQDEEGDVPRKSKKAKVAVDASDSGKKLKQKGAAAQSGLKQFKEGTKKSAKAAKAELKEDANGFASESGDDEAAAESSGAFQMFAATARKGQTASAAGAAQKRKAGHSKTRCTPLWLRTCCAKRCADIAYWATSGS